MMMLWMMAAEMEEMTMEETVVMAAEMEENNKTNDFLLKTCSPL
jgi:hypothetical protein